MRNVLPLILGGVMFGLMLGMVLERATRTTWPLPDPLVDQLIVVRSTTERAAVVQLPAFALAPGDDHWYVRIVAVKNDGDGIVYVVRPDGNLLHTIIARYSIARYSTVVPDGRWELVP